MALHCRFFGSAGHFDFLELTCQNITKYCIISERSEIVECFKEKTPIRQSQYFEHRIKTIEERYKNIKIVSCGYGKRNIDSVMQINELTALAIGANYLKPDIEACS